MAEKHFSWMVGDVRITRVVELELPGLRFVIPDATQENCKKIPWLFPHFATPDGKPIAAVQTFVVESQGRRIAVDTCIGNGKSVAIPFWCNLNLPFLADFEAAGFSRESIDTVMCTHLHVDHVGWNTMKLDDRWVPTFPKAEYLFGRVEFDSFINEPRPGNAGLLEQSIQPIVDAGLHKLVEVNHRITDEVWLEPSHGHTKGHCSVRIKSDGYEAVITGDLLHHPSQIAHPEWGCVADYDPEMALRTRRDFIARHADTPMLVIGTHFAAPTRGKIVKDGGGFRFVV